MQRLSLVPAQRAKRFIIAHDPIRLINGSGIIALGTEHETRFELATLY